MNSPRSILPRRRSNASTERRRSAPLLLVHRARIIPPSKLEILRRLAAEQQALRGERRLEDFSQFDD